MGSGSLSTAGGHPVRRPLPARGGEPLRGRRQRRRLVALRALRRGTPCRPARTPEAVLAPCSGGGTTSLVRCAAAAGAPRPRGGHAAVGLAAAGRPARRRRASRATCREAPGRAARGRHPPGRRRQLLVRLRAVHPGRGGAGDAQELRRHARVQPRGRLQAAALPRGRVAHAARGRPAAVQRPRDARLRPRPRGRRRGAPTHRLASTPGWAARRALCAALEKAAAKPTARTRRWRAAPSPSLPHADGLPRRPGAAPRPRATAAPAPRARGARRRRRRRGGLPRAFDKRFSAAPTRPRSSASRASSASSRAASPSAPRRSRTRRRRSARR